MAAPYSFKNLILGSLDAFRANDSMHGYDYVMARQERDNAAYATGPGSSHRGGFGEITHGFIDGHKVTFAKGWGTKEGETLIADGHITAQRFFAGEGQLKRHEHYGAGKGAKANGTRRGRYSGPGR